MPKNRKPFAAIPALGIALIVAACGGAPAPAGTPEPASPAVTASEDKELPPPGYGTLRQDDFTIAFQSGGLQIKVTPLDEEVIRLAAPDTYQRLHGLVASRTGPARELGRGGGQRKSPRVFLVSFFTNSQQAQYRPTELYIISRGIQYRPRSIVPLTPGWGREQVMQEQTQSAVYLFDPAIDLDIAFTLQYTNESTLAWAGIGRTLETERSRVLARAKS